MRDHVTVLSLLAGCLACGAAAAQDAYPSKPIRLLVPFAPGGGTNSRENCAHASPAGARLPNGLTSSGPRAFDRERGRPLQRDSPRDGRSPDRPGSTLFSR